MNKRLIPHKRKLPRVRVTVTAVNEPDLDDPADYMYIQVKSTDKLRDLMAEYAARVPSALLYEFRDAPINILPQHGQQLRITAHALEEVTGYWGNREWREEEGIQLSWVEWALDDFVRVLSGCHALVQWAR